MSISLSTLFLAAFLILFGINALGWVVVGATLLGAVAVIAGVLVLVESYHPLKISRPIQNQ